MFYLLAAGLTPCLEEIFRFKHICVLIKNVSSTLIRSLGSGQPSVELLSNLTASCEPPNKVPRLVEPQPSNNVSPVAFDAPKRTRFTFRPEHLDVRSAQASRMRPVNGVFLAQLDPREGFCR
jgi:hypothetical protein